MFRLSIVTPEKVCIDADVASLTAPGADGYLGVLSHHAPLITTLKPGKIEYRDDQNVIHVMAVTNGFLEVSANRATILADAAEDAADIDIARARAAYERSRAQLISAEKGETSIDLPATQSALERAANRIRVYNETHK
ncbi:F0F1 ATP synthase subunit epsilon [candidate division GN15 bacterium]|uniref:ATP synthase epsilon chain n=1 Tax=candidate division GN15 bacterium TaxID=2072418 RepID=A0A855WWJ5_9BACT|nr:MAG: F0F1 ATP synthase subunit epsilon [candidate division GN15 bacterium]